MMTTHAIQRALIALGHDPGPADGIAGAKTRAAIVTFQRAAGLAADGVAGPKTQAALQARLAERAEPRTAPSTVSAEWMPDARIDRIIVHWTAGQHRASGLDRRHYHILIEGDGTVLRGTPSIALNDASGARSGYAAHTLGCNTGSIGVAVCAMAKAIESPFSAGPAPLTAVQWATLLDVLSVLCRRYRIPVTARTVLSHAEVQETLGIKQRGKWDISRLPFDPHVRGAHTCGALMRAAVAACL